MMYINLIVEETNINFYCNNKFNIEEVKSAI